MAAPAAPTSLIHTIISLKGPGPHTTFQNSHACTVATDSNGYGQGCVSTPTCPSLYELSTDTSTALYGIPILICTSASSTPQLSDTSSTMSSNQPGGPLSSATETTTSNPGGVMSSASPSSSLSVQPGGPVRTSVLTVRPTVSLHHTSITADTSTVTSLGTSTAVTGTSTSSSPTSSVSGNAASGLHQGGGEGSLMGLVLLCWMGAWGWRTLRGRI